MAESKRILPVLGLVVALLFPALMTAAHAARNSTAQDTEWSAETLRLAAANSESSPLLMERYLRDMLRENPPFAGSDAQDSALPEDSAPGYAQPYQARHAPGYSEPAQLQPSYSPSSHPAPAIACYQNGSSYFSQQRWHDAIDQFSMAVEAEPRFAKAYAVRGLAYAVLGHFDKAINDSTIALEINPNLSFAYETRAIGHYARYRYGEAWRDVRKAQSLGHAVNPRFLGDLRRASGRRN